MKEREGEQTDKSINESGVRKSKAHRNIWRETVRLKEKKRNTEKINRVIIREIEKKGIDQESH